VSFGTRQSVLIHTPCPGGIRLTGVERLDEQEAVLAAQRDVLARTLTLTTNRYRAGYSRCLDPLDAERGSLVAKLARVHGRADRLNALVTPYQACAADGGAYRSIDPATAGLDRECGGTYTGRTT
jgi:hypothetical protein